MSMISPTPSGPEDRTARRHSLRLLALSLLLVFAAAAVGAIASIDAAGFYARLARPAWAPPGWLFGPVWSVLYGLMALALWRVWRVRPAKSRPVRLFFAQLAVNAAWSWLFFRLHLGAVSFLWIVVLAVLLAITVAAFWRVSRVAGALLLPYMGWVLFACALAGAVWRANPAALG
jgi:tryptophan-rich sensory protein